MVIVAACVVAVVAGLGAAVAWRGRSFEPPPAGPSLSPRDAARRFAWYAALAVGGGVVCGVTMIGAGGRLAMRLLAVTAGSAAQGRLTEADQVVGKVTAAGTVDFVLFNGIFGGVAAAVLYLLVRRLLPGGWPGGVTFGLGLLLVLGTTIDPLRSDNPDFDLVGPGWLAVVVFTALAVAFGLMLAAVLARLSEWLPLLSTEGRVLVRYAVPAVMAGIAIAVAVVLAAVCLAVVLATRWQGLVDAVRSRRWVLAGRVVMVGVAVAALPNSVGSIADIVTG